jgi:hypothetical protein
LALVAVQAAQAAKMGVAVGRAAAAPVGVVPEEAQGRRQRWRRLKKREEGGGVEGLVELIAAGVEANTRRGGRRGKGEIERNQIIERLFESLQLLKRHAVPCSTGAHYRIGRTSIVRTQ